MLIQLIYYVSLCSPLLPIVIGIRRKGSLLWYYAIIGLVFDMVMSFMSEKGITQAWLGNIFMLTEFAIISYYYKPRIFPNARVFYLLTAPLAALFIGSTIYMSVWKFNSYGETVFDLICIIYALLGLYKILKEQKTLFIEQSSFFWVNVAVLLYASGNFLIFLFQAYLISSDKAVIYALWLIHNILNIIFSILLALSLSRKKP